MEAKMVLFLCCFLKYLRMLTSEILLSIVSSSILIGVLFLTDYDDYRAYPTPRESCIVDICEEPTVDDANLKVEAISTGLKKPTSMAFLGDDDILVLELNGTVRRIVDNVLQPKPLLDVNVSKITGERGLLGIAISKDNSGRAYVFLYYTESRLENGEALGNRLYRYNFINNQLLNPTLLLDLPAFPGPFHNGGAITIGPDGNIYVPIGDLYDGSVPLPNTQAQNIDNGEKPNGSGGILRITQDGNVVGKGILGVTHPLNLYYAYGIRNSFGIDFDPVTGILWDAENGPNYGDEINLVEPGFNSGWRKVQGIWYDKGGNINYTAEDTPTGLLDFNGKGKYSNPEFTWEIDDYGPTALKFLNSDKIGEEYENDMFVGEVHHGYLYHFELNEDRSQLSFDDSLSDKVLDDEKELGDIIFGQGFEGGITDLEVGPDGYLYIVSGIWSGEGKIYRVAPLEAERPRLNE
jgi:aldose sugar dehydrogenase